MVLGFLKKPDYRASIEPAGEVVTVRGGGKLLNAALAAGLDWPHDCRVGSCGTCRCTLKSGRIKALTDFGYTLEPEEIRAGVILACQSRLLCDVEIEVTLGRARVALEHEKGRISHLERLTHDILEVEVSFDEPAFASALAGQYATLSFAGLDDPRSYSFAARPRPEGSKQLKFSIRHVPGGTFTNWLFDADRLGEELEVSGPYGQFTLRPPARRMICVAGGSGLAPILALIEEGISVARDDPCVVLFGARTSADLYYLARLAAAEADWRGKFELVTVLSEEPPQSNWQGPRGVVTDELRRLGDGSFVEDRAYLCGPPQMVDAGIAELQRLGMPATHIHYDKFLDASTQAGGRPAIEIA